MADVGIFYATISGRTRRTVQQVEQAWSPLSVVSYDLRDGCIDCLQGHSLLLFGSPTYGTGEFHHLWEKWSELLAEQPIDWPRQAVSLFTLGDLRHHRDTFAGAILHLRDMVAKLGVKPLGRMPNDDTYDQEACRRLLREDRFPGLVLDQVGQRHLTETRIRAWVDEIRRER